MPTKTPENTSGEVRINLDATAYTWSDTRNASTGTLASVNSGTVSVFSDYTGLRGNTFRISRGYLNFDLSSVSGTITDLSLKLVTANLSATRDIIIVKSTAPDGSNIATSDFGDADLSTAYSSEFTTFSNTAGTTNTITLNSTAISDANTNSELILAVVDHDYDYSNSQPSAGAQTALGYVLSSFTEIPLLEYTVQTGYGQTINGVVAANINKILNVGRLNVKRVIDTPNASTFTLAGITGESDNVNVTSLINGSSAGSSIQPFVDPSGTRLYIPEYSNKKIRQLSMSSANNISSTITNVGVSSALTNSFTHFQMSADGTKAYIMYSNSVVQYTLSTAWDITTMATIGSTLNLLVPAGGLTRGMHFSPDGTQLIIMTIDTSPSQINLLKYTLSTAFNITTAGSPTTSDITSTGPGTPSSTIGLCVIEDAGTLHYVVTSSGNDDTRYEDGILNADFAEQTSLVYAPHVSCEYTGNYMYSLRRTGASGNYTWTLYQHLTNI